jgi:hypothetical protein
MKHVIQTIEAVNRGGSPSLDRKVSRGRSELLADKDRCAGDWQLSSVMRHK